MNDFPGNMLLLRFNEVYYSVPCIISFSLKDKKQKQTGPGPVTKSGACLMGEIYKIASLFLHSFL